MSQSSEEDETGQFRSRTFYPVHLLDPLLDHLRPEAQVDLGRRLVDADVRTGPYRFLRPVLQIDTLTEIADALFTNYFAGGQVEVALEDSHSLRMRWSGFEGMSRRTWRVVEGMAERLSTLAGIRHPSWKRIEGGRSGDGEMLVRIQRKDDPWSTLRPRAQAGKGGGSGS